MWIFDMFKGHKHKIEQAKKMLSEAVEGSTDANNNVVNSGKKLRQSLAQSGNCSLKKILKDMG